MFVTTLISWDIDGNVIAHEGYEYSGPVELCCGASDEQHQVFTEQNDLMKNLTGQMQTIFGNSSSVFKDLMSAYAPIVAGGPNQQGYSLPEQAALKSQAIEDTGNAYAHARQAVGEHQAAQGGGTLALPGGSNEAADINLASSAAAQTAGSLTKINENNYEQGRENFFNAAKGLSGATDVFNPATSAGNAATEAGSSASTTANEISQASNSWESAVGGALGGITSSLVAPGGWLGKSK